MLGPFTPFGGLSILSALKTQKMVSYSFNLLRTHHVDPSDALNS